MTPAIVSRSAILVDGKIDRMDAEFFDSYRTAFEKSLDDKGARKLAAVASLLDDRVDPAKGEGAEFMYVEIGGVDGRDGFVLAEMRDRASAPSRARLALKKDLVVLSSVRPLRNQVFLVSEDLAGGVSSTGFLPLQSTAVPPQLLFAYLKTNHAIAQLDRRARASMYPAVAPHDVLDIRFPRIHASVAAEATKAIDSAMRERQLFLRASMNLAHVLDGFFAPMGPDLLLDGLRRRGHKTLNRSDLAALSFDRMDAEFHAPAFEAAFARMKAAVKTDRLGSLSEQISTGKSPAPAEYEDPRADNAAVIKQGCLTGLGVRWADVSFAPTRYLYMLGNDAQADDILFTSTAHQPLYIGHRVDVVSGVPEELAGRLTFNADLMRIRLADPQSLPPAYVAAFLRNPLGKEQIRRCVRGVSSHVYPEDIAEILVPLPSKKLANETRRRAAKVERHRWAFTGHVRRAVEILERHIDRGLSSPSSNGSKPV